MYEALATVRSKTAKVERAKNKVEKLKGQLADAREELKEAREELKQSKANEKLGDKKPTAKPKPDQKPKPAATIEVNTDGKKEAFKKTRYKKFNPTMKGKKWFNELNEGCSFPENIEGYWRDNVDRTSEGDSLPFPIAMPVPGYDRRTFYNQLMDFEDTNTRASGRSGRGRSPDRWTGELIPGAGELVPRRGAKKFSWPIAYSSYIKRGVPPSRAFYKFITGEDNPNLPTYGR